MSTVFTVAARRAGAAKPRGGDPPTITPDQPGGQPGAIPAAAASPHDVAQPTARQRAQQLAEASRGRVRVAGELDTARRLIEEARRRQLAEAPRSREECELAARQQRFLAIAPPVAWEQAEAQDAGRHLFAIQLLRREVWGCYELHRMNERRLTELWSVVAQVRDLLRLAVRGDPQQLVLFGLIGQEGEVPSE